MYAGPGTRGVYGLRHYTVSLYNRDKLVCLLEGPAPGAAEPRGAAPWAPAPGASAPGMAAPGGGTPVGTTRLEATRDVTTTRVHIIKVSTRQAVRGRVSPMSIAQEGAAPEKSAPGAKSRHCLLVLQCLFRD